MSIAHELQNNRKILLKNVVKTNLYLKILHGTLYQTKSKCSEELLCATSCEMLPVHTLTSEQSAASKMFLTLVLKKIFRKLPQYSAGLIKILVRYAGNSPTNTVYQEQDIFSCSTEHQEQVISSKCEIYYALIHFT